jgi:predicted short-subunit dehydrogenase-like oxidoreductase (DUF2520 family)
MIRGGEDVVAIAGAGPLAQALGKALQECEIDVRYIASRSLDRAKRAASVIGASTIAVPYSGIPSKASHVIIAVSDRAIAPVAAQFAKANSTIRIALHTSGSYGPELLAPLQSAGVSCGSIHPLQTVRGGPQGAAALRIAAFAVSGDRQALAWAEEIAARLSGQILHINPGARHLYHAAAVMASNYVAALLDSAEQLMLLAGVPKADALRSLAPLVRTSVDNVVNCGAVDALTGPVVRGDAPTVADHLQALNRAPHSITELYKAAGLRALAMARERGLGEEDAERVLQALLARR